MADPLNLGIWFPTFFATEMLPRLVSVLRQFPFSPARPGVENVVVQPISWSEPSTLERRFRPGLDPEQAASIAADLLHDDYAYILESYWDLWTPEDEVGRKWKRQPQPVRFIAQGLNFDDETYQQTGHIQVDFGPDAPFLYEDIELDEAEEMRVRSNVQKLVSFTINVEKNCGISGRVLWSESEENLAQKLISRLQKVQ